MEKFKPMPPTSKEVMERLSSAATRRSEFASRRISRALHNLRIL